MLLTVYSCWASSNLSRRKKNSRFAPDGAHKAFQVAGPETGLEPREARERHSEGRRSRRQENKKSFSVRSATSVKRRFVNESLVRDS